MSRPTDTSVKGTFHSLHRTIYSRLSVRQIPDLLQSIFAAELLAPSKCLWLVSPWVSDIPILDNSAAEFASIQSSWPSGPIRLTDVLLHLMELGASVHVATRDDPHNEQVRQRLSTAALERDLPLRLHKDKDLHEKGLLGDGFFLSGSMNFTHNGISLNKESVTLVTDPTEIPAHQLAFSKAWGGPLK